MTKKPINRKERNQGMNWISPKKRLAIYLRDGLACCYCGSSVEEGTKLTLDHIKPHSKGGSNHEKNLITACHHCNSVRGARRLEDFCVHVAVYLNHGIHPDTILSYIRSQVKLTLTHQITRAQILIEARGSFTAALHNAK